MILLFARRCAPGYYGLRCHSQDNDVIDSGNQSANRSSISTTVTAVVVVLVVIVVLISAAAAAITIMRKRRRYVNQPPPTHPNQQKMGTLSLLIAVAVSLTSCQLVERSRDLLTSNYINQLAVLFALFGNLVR